MNLLKAGFLLFALVPLAEGPAPSVIQPTTYAAGLVSPSGSGNDWAPLTGNSAGSASLSPTTYAGMLTCTANCSDPYRATWAPWAGATSGGGAPSGPAGGDLSGTYPNPTVSATHATSGTLDNVTIDPTTCGHYASGTMMGLGTCAPGTWSGVSGAGGTNFQLKSQNSGDLNVRLIVVSQGTGGGAAEFHFVNTGASSNQRNWRMSADTYGHYILGMNTDNYSSSTSLLDCVVASGCGLPVGASSPVFATKEAGTITAAATIAPSTALFHLTGTTSVTTMTPPTGMATSTGAGLVGGTVTIIADSATPFSAGTGYGQFKSAFTTTAGVPYFCVLTPSTGLWYCK